MDDGRSKWDDFDGGKLANENTQRKIDAWHANNRKVNAYRTFQALVVAGIVVCLYLLFDGAR